MLGGFMFGAGLLVYLFYLKRMLRHLDPSRTIPARVRHALDSLTEGLLVLDADGVIMLANQSLAEVLGVRGGRADRAVGEPTSPGCASRRQRCRRAASCRGSAHCATGRSSATCR